MRACSSSFETVVLNEMKAEFLPKTDYVYASDEEDFIEEKDLSVCAVNAGDGALYLGGGGINRAFEFEMRNSGISNKDVAPLNQKAVDLIRSGDYGQGVFIPVPAAKPFKYVYTIGALLGEENAGLVVLFVWNGKNAPKQFQSNVGMLYVVGPRGGCQPTAEFESLLEKLSYNTVRIVQLFNEAHPDDKIGALR